MTKELYNLIMKRSRNKNQFLKDGSQTSRENYKIQQNFCKELLMKTKKLYFECRNTKKKKRKKKKEKKWIIETAVSFFFSHKRRQKVRRLFLMKQKTYFC